MALIKYYNYHNEEISENQAKQLNYYQKGFIENDIDFNWTGFEYYQDGNTDYPI